jgi:hypothetical protein
MPCMGPNLECNIVIHLNISDSDLVWRTSFSAYDCITVYTCDMPSEW